MVRRISLTICALVLGLTMTAGADEVVTGTVVRVDQDSRVIVLNDARMFRVTEDGAVLVDNRPIALPEITPGTQVLIRSGQPVAYNNGQYIVITDPAASATTTAIVTAPPAATTVTPPPPPAPITLNEGVMNGTVSRIDEPSNVVVLSDGRMVQIGPKTIIMVNGHPVELAALRPGQGVVISAANPVVYRNGRYVLLNSGFRDPDTNSTLTWDSKWEGYEAELAHAGMQIQSL